MKIGKNSKKKNEKCAFKMLFASSLIAALFIIIPPFNIIIELRWELAKEKER